MRFHSSTVIRLVTILATAPLFAACLSSGGTEEASAAPPGSPPPPPPPPPSGNSAPTISGTPPTSVLIDEEYVFVPNASDPDGDTLTFTVSNKPGWADFDDTTGELSGIPDTGDVGMYSNISITVSDGIASDSTPNFSVEVTQVQLGAVTLSWTAPTQYTDGSQLDDLAGYKIYYGVSQGNYPNQIEIDNPGLTTYMVENLTPATYYFVATAVNDAGMESDFSNMAPVTVQAP